MHLDSRTLRCLLLTFIPLLPAVQQIRAQHHDILSTDSLVTTHWGTKEGLPSNEARPILQSRDGYIWIGTGFGLARFDGIRFDVFNAKSTPEIKASDVTALHEDPAGNLWVGFQSGGVLKYAGGQFQAPASCARIAFATIADFFSDSTGGLYVCSNEGLLHVRGDSGSFVTFLPEIATHGFTTPDNSVYVYNNLIVCISSTSRPQVVGALPSRGRISYLRPESSSSFLAAGLDYIQRFRPAKDGSLIPTERYPLELSSSLLSDGNGQYLLGTFGRGIVRFDGGRISTPQGFTLLRGPGRQVHNLLRDSEGGVWATTSGGVFRFSRSFFKTFGEASGLANEYTWNIRLTHDGTLWAGAGRGGTYRIKDGTSRLFLMKDGMPDNHVTEMFESSDGRMWFGGDNSRLVTIYKEVTRRLDQLPGYHGGRVLSIAEDFNKKIWVGTREGLQTFEGNRFESHPLHRDGGQYYVRCITPAPNGDIWYVRSGFVNRLRNDTVTEFKERDEQAVFGAFALLVDSNRVWYGTYGGGLYLIRGDSVINLRTLYQGFGPRIISILEDRFGYLWLNAERELQRVRKTDILQALDHPGQNVRVDVYNHLDGLENIEFNYSSTNSAQLIPDGRILYASTSGIVVVDPAEADRSTTPPKVTIEGIVADDDPVDFQNGARLPPGTRRVDIKYAALQFQTPGRVRFKVRLAGVDRYWVETEGLQRSMTYTNLGNGDFQFAVTASSNDGPWNPQAATVAFSIAPYLYQRWPVRIASILTVLILLVVGYNARIHRIRARNRILEEEINLRRKVEERLTGSLEEKTVMLKEIHHRVKNNMQVISSLMSLQLGSSTEPMVQEALTESQARIRSMALVHETLYRSDNLAAIGFRDYLERLVLQVHHANQKSSVSIHVEGADIPVPLDQAIPAGLLMNELVTNAIKHAFPDGATGSITVLARQCDGDIVELGVTDNGKGLPDGFDIAKSTTLGLRLVSTLTGQLGGTLSVKKNDPGTTITVQFPTK